MTVERTQRPEGTPRGGVYTVTAYINFETGASCDKSEATGAIISEYDANDQWLGETVASFDPASRDCPND